MSWRMADCGKDGIRPRLFDELKAERARDWAHQFHASGRWEDTFANWQAFLDTRNVEAQRTTKEKIK